MNSPIRIRSVLLFLGLPALWFGSFSISEKISIAQLSSPNFEFVPVTVHASHSADYSIDEFTNSFAPVDEDIVTDAQADQGITPPVLPELPAVQDPNTGNGSDDSQDQDGGVQSTPAPIQNPGQGQGQTEDNGNKDKDADSPGNSGSDHGNGSGNGGNGNGGNGKSK